MIFFIILSLIQTSLNYSDKPQKENALTFSKHLTIVDEDEGFYKRVSTTIAQNGSIATYDSGNKVVHVYNSLGIKQFSFGKEGNGPGEFSNYTSGPFITNSRIYMRQWDKTMVFNYEGILLIEHKLRQIFGNARTINNQLIINLTQTREKEFLRIEFSEDGKSYKEIKNPLYSEDYKKKMQVEWYNNPKLTKNDPVYLLPFVNETYIRSYRGEYRFEILDKNRNILTKVTRQFKRLKDIPDLSWQKKMKERAKKSKNKAYMKSTTAYIANHDAEQDGFKSDITDVFRFKNYILIEVESGSKSELAYDVYTEDLKFYTTALLKLEEDYASSSLVNNKLIVNHTNDEDGPYSVIYSIEVADELNLTHK
jgi:hypothetical protein